MNINTIKKILDKQDLDIRKTKNQPRFLDQKCAPDVISFIADMIQEEKNPFTRFDIQNKESFSKLVTFIFGKPSSKNKNLANEYDKFIGQILDMFAHAGILEKTKESRNNFFKIKEKNILEYISVSPTTAYRFLIEYLSKFLKDSSLEKYFHPFFEQQNQENFELLKDKFVFFMLQNSRIGTRGSKTCGVPEIRRIFPKILNPLALDKNLKGTNQGGLSKGIITFAELMYNRNNFRDINKLKNISRREQEEINQNNHNYNKYLLTKAKQHIKRLHPDSEVKDSLYGKTTSIHHIFPRKDFPKIADYLENLIALTGGQHTDRAHPNGITGKIDIPYQQVCLKAKLNTIKKFKSNYSKDNFIHIINTGFRWLNTKKAIDLKARFDVIGKHIDSYYKDT